MNSCIRINSNALVEYNCGHMHSYFPTIIFPASITDSFEIMNYLIKVKVERKLLLVVNALTNLYAYSNLVSYI